MESFDMSLLQSENQQLRAEISLLHKNYALLYKENQYLRQLELDLLSALELALLEKSDLEIMLDLVSTHGDAVEGELFLAAEKAWLAAGIDELTQLPNRRQLLEYLDRMWRQMIRQGQPLSLLMCDVDFFKPFNDFYGHQTGDVCLRLIAEGISNGIQRPIDLASRYGGEEFVVVLPNTDRLGAIRVAETIRAQVALLHIPHEANPMTDFVTISIGVATTVPQRGTVPTSLLQTADEALFQAKRGGRNQVAVAP
jgi:diguanylate cyclase (GGDEF)-like protein